MSYNWKHMHKFHKHSQIHLPTHMGMMMYSILPTAWHKHILALFVTKILQVKLGNLEGKLSFTLMLVSKEPDATKLPKGWKSRLQIFALWPSKVRRTGKWRGRAGRRNREQIFSSSFPPKSMQKFSHTILTIKHMLTQCTLDMLHTACSAVYVILQKYFWFYPCNAKKQQ